MTIPTIAIVGRPNVGKSTLFNRLAGKQLAIVDDQPGVTRDYRAAEASVGGKTVQLYDTAGMEDNSDDVIYRRMRAQTERALSLADLAVFVVDGRAGITPLDQSLAKWIRRQKKPVILVINKCERDAPEHVRAEAHELGLGAALAISASHGDGIVDLVTEILQHLPDSDEEESAKEKPLRLAIIGRPNAGKSTLLNTLIDEQRVMTGEEAGLTRDAIAVDWEYEGQAIRLVDTAGLRRQSRVDRNSIEQRAVQDTQRIIRLAEVVMVVMDVQTLFDKQDLQITQQVIDEGRGLVIVVNKWDLVEDKNATRKAIDERLEDLFHHAKAVPVITLSALRGGNVMDKLMKQILAVHAIWNKRISTGKLNRWLSALLERHPPPMVGGRPIKIRYMTQIKSRPPTFGLWCSRPEELPQSYEKYLINNLRKDFDLPGVPLRIVRRKGENPYEGKVAAGDKSRKGKAKPKTKTKSAPRQKKKELKKTNNPWD